MLNIDAGTILRGRAAIFLPLAICLSMLSSRQPSVWFDALLHIAYTLLISTLHEIWIFRNQFVREQVKKLCSLCYFKLQRRWDHRDHRFFLPLILFSRSKRGGGILKNLKNSKLQRESNPVRISTQVSGKNLSRSFPAAETDLGFTFVVTFQSTWSFNEISGKLRVTRIVVVVAERPQFVHFSPFKRSSNGHCLSYL